MATRRVTLIAVAGLFLTSCASIPGSLQLIDAVQKLTQATCSFVPTVATVLALLNLNRPDLVAAAEIAKAICESIDQPAALRAARGAPPRLHGVPIEGFRVR